LPDNGKGQDILLRKILLYQIKEHSLHIFPSSATPVQLFAHIALPYLKEIKYLFNEVKFKYWK
jgi:hypothetical protein